MPGEVSNGKGRRTLNLLGKGERDKVWEREKCLNIR